MTLKQTLTICRCGHAEFEHNLPYRLPGCGCCHCSRFEARLQIHNTKKSPPPVRPPQALYANVELLYSNIYANME